MTLRRVRNIPKSAVMVPRGDLQLHPHLMRMYGRGEDWGTLWVDGRRVWASRSNSDWSNGMHIVEDIAEGFGGERE